MQKLILSLLSLFLITQSVFASEIIPYSIKRFLKHSASVDYISVIISLGIVILLIYITSIIYAKLNELNQKTVKKQFKDFDESRVVIYSSTPIGQNKTLYVIGVYDKKLLIGVSNENISLIKDLSEKQDNDKNIVRNLNYNQESSLLDKIYPSKDDFVKYKNNEEKDNSEEEKEMEEVETETETTTVKVDNEEYGIYKKYLK